MIYPELSKAYLFWLPSLVGVAGLHRFYLGKPLSGLLYLMTGGLAGIGTIYDALTMPNLVRHAQVRMHLEGQMQDGINTILDYARRSGGRGGGAASGFSPHNAPRDPVEHAALSLAKRNGGVVTPSQVAIDAQISAAAAREALEKLVAQGFAELQVTRVGVMVYAFPEFLTDDARANLETF